MSVCLSICLSAFFCRQRSITEHKGHIDRRLSVCPVVTLFLSHIAIFRRRHMHCLECCHSGLNSTYLLKRKVSLRTVLSRDFTPGRFIYRRFTWFSARQCPPLISYHGQRCEVIAWGGWNYRINLYRRPKRRKKLLFFPSAEIWPASYDLGKLNRKCVLHVLCNFTTLKKTVYI